MTASAIRLPQLLLLRSRLPRAALARQSGAVGAYLLIGSLALGLYFVADVTTGSVAYLIISALPVVALLVGPLVHRPRSVLPWLWLAAGQAAFFVGDVIWFSDQLGGKDVFPSAADVAYLAAYPLLAAGLALLIRGHRPTMRLVPLIDALVIAVVGALIAWLLYVDPWVDDQALLLTDKLVMLAHPIGDALLVALAAYLLLAGRSASRLALLALVGAFVLRLQGDTSYAGVAGGLALDASLPDAAWLGSYLLIGLTALLPSMRSLTEPYLPERSSRGPWPRLLAGIVLFAAPVFAVSHGELDVGVILGTQVVMVAALLVRVREAGKSEDAASQQYMIASDQVRRLGAVIEQTSDAVIIADRNANIEYVNPAFELITGYRKEEVIGRNPRFLQGGAQSPGFYTAMWNTLTGGGPWVADFVNRRKDGTTYTAEAVISPLRDVTGAITGYVGVSRDVTDERRQVERVVQLARERTIIRETIRGIDGHQPPEAIAQSVCEQIASLDDVMLAALFVFDPDGRAVPYGFAVATHERAPRRRVPRARTTYLHERALQGPWIEAWQTHPRHPYNELITHLGIRAFAYTPVRDGAAVVGFLVVGSAVTKAQEQLAKVMPALIESGDLAGAMIGVKVAARSEVSAERQRVSQIIDRTEFHPVFQPLVDSLSNRIVGYEALTRFSDGTAPDVRFAEAHAVGAGERLELAAIRAALGHAEQLPPETWLNINASPALVLDGGELQRLTTSSTRDLVVEVTEHSEITDYPAFRRAIQQLGPQVRLAVDDAGAGFASLRHIIELRPSFVKLDRQVIAGIDHDEARQAMVAGLRHFAQNTGCWLIAEGVETQAELDTLRELEVRYVQGYLLAEPMAAEQLPGHLRGWPIRNRRVHPD